MNKLYCVKSAHTGIKRNEEVDKQQNKPCIEEWEYAYNSCRPYEVKLSRHCII